MLSIILDRILLALSGVALFTRLFLPLSLRNIESLGQEHIATLINNFILFSIALLFILKKSVFNENIRFSNIFLPLGSFCFIASVSFFYSIDAPSSMLYMFDLWSSFFFMLVLVNLLTNEKLIKIFMGTMIVLMAMTSAHAIYEYLVILPQMLAQASHGMPMTDRGDQELLSSHRTPTLFGWPNILAGFLVMTLPLAVALLITLRQRSFKIMLGIAVLLALYALLVTMTVSSWLGILVAAILYFLILKNRPLTPQEKKLSFLIISIFLIIIAFVAVKKMSQPGVSSTFAREQYFISSCSLIKLHPYIGNGWRSYGVANTAYIKNINGRSYFAHNTYLQIWTELGIIGLILFFSYLWLLWKDAIVLIQSHLLKNRWLMGSVIAAIGGCMADNFFSYTMIKPQVALFWWVLCGLLIALKENIEPSANHLKTQMAWKKFFILLTLAGMIMTFRLTLSEYDFFKAVQYIHAGTHLEEAQDLCLKGKNLAPWDKKFDLARAYALYAAFTRDLNVSTLQQAHDAVLHSEGQVSLGFERDALVKRINDTLAKEQKK